MDLKITQREKSYDINKGISLPVDITSRKIGDTYLFLAPEKASLITANEIGKKIIENFRQGLTIKEVIGTLQKDGMPVKEIEKELHDILVKVEKKGFYEDAAVLEPDVPPTLHLDITNQCNLSCVHCIRDAGKKAENELETRDWLNIIDRFASIYETHVTISGGEPLLHPGFFEIITRAKNRGLSVTLFTNGTMLTEKTIKKIIGKIEKIQISLDGASELVNDQIRGKGSFKKIMEAILLINKVGIPLDIALSVMPQNLEDFFENSRYLLEKIGPKGNLRISEVTKRGRATASHTVKSKEDTQNFINYMYEKRFRPPEKLHKNIKMNICGYGETITISSRGDIYPCSIYDEVAIYGNIKTHNLVEVFQRIAKDRKNSTISNMKQCLSCDLRSICCGGCRINNIHLAGDILTPECTCTKDYKENIYSRLVLKEKNDPLSLWVGEPNRKTNLF